jgi:ketosteroid isomerase-like protein
LSSGSTPAYTARDFDHVAATLHDDIDWIIYSPVSVFPFAGQRKGRAAVLQAMADIGAQYTLDIYRHEIIVGDRAAVMSDARFTQRATNRILRFRIANFLRFEDAKLIEFREFVNSFDVVEQALGRELAL